ncbi:MAG: type II toxin-antitoxin system HipA family toxin [Woeseiaceae bacterium]
MRVISVYYHRYSNTEPIFVGRLVHDSGLSHFQYDADFLTLDLNLSPFKLEMHGLLQSAPSHPFSGLHGLFNDSLPDGWGMYLMNKDFKNHGLALDDIYPIDRLAYMGSKAMGALSYLPDDSSKFHLNNNEQLNLNELAKDSINLYTGEIDDVLSYLAINGTPSGGARPKVLLGLKGKETISGAYDLPVNFEHWLAKFPTGKNAEDKAEGAIEYLYSIMARQAGIDFPETKLVAGKNDNAYFLIKRFDRDKGNKRIHMQTLAGLVNADFRLADFDYDRLLKVCSAITKSHKEVTQLFKRMLFNVMSGNRDDHTKNFSFLMDDKGIWRNSPAYDITFNRGINGEHSMLVGKSGKNITQDDISLLAKTASLKNKEVQFMIDEVSEELSSWQNEALNYTIPKSRVVEISNYMEKQRKRLITK